LFLILLLSLSFVACAENNSLQKKYGAESFYFLGLQSLEKKDINKAEYYFHKAGKKSSSLIAEKSLQELSKLGTVKDRQERLIKLYKKFPTEENLLLLSKELFLQKEYAKIINYTNKINLEECDNKLAYYRIISLLEKKSTKFNNEFLYWCTQKNYTSFHHKVFFEVRNSSSLN
jgi:soluble lytic murein transglycosylase